MSQIRIIGIGIVVMMTALFGDSGAQPRPSVILIMADAGSVRPAPIGFKSYNARAYTDNQYKIVSVDDGITYELFDLLNDPRESEDISEKHPDIVARLKGGLDDWIRSCKESASGGDHRNN